MASSRPYTSILISQALFRQQLDQWGSRFANVLSQRRRGWEGSGWRGGDSLLLLLHLSEYIFPEIDFNFYTRTVRVNTMTPPECEIWAALAISAISEDT